MCLDCINELMDILVAHSNIFVGENILEESENLNNFDQVRGGIGRITGRQGLVETRVQFRLGPWINVFLLCILQPLRVRGCILTLVERMDEEFTKIMQNTDPHSQGKPRKRTLVRGTVQVVTLT